MSQTTDLERVTERIQKLLALGRRNTSEAEAEAAMAKAMALLAEHNLDMAAVEGAQAGSARREKAAQAGGMYVYQRELWDQVARLNFCLHFRRHSWVRAGQREVRRNFHMIVGRTVNVRAAIAMGTYLEQTIDRLCRDRLVTRSGAGSTPGELNSQFFTSWAVAFREGVSDRVIDKIATRRSQQLAEERQRQREAERAADGVSTSTALSLSVYIDRETDANIDFMYGDGTSARWAQQRAEQAAEQAQREAEHAAWAAANPEEAAREAEAERRRARARSGRAAPARRIDAGGYWAGHEAGARVGIDPQAEGHAAGGRLR